MRARQIAMWTVQTGLLRDGCYLKRPRSALRISLVQSGSGEAMYCITGLQSQRLFLFLVTFWSSSARGDVLTIRGKNLRI